MSYLRTFGESLRRVPIEVHALAVPGALAVVAVVAADYARVVAHMPHFAGALQSTLAFGNAFLLYFCGVIEAYLIYRFARLFFRKKGRAGRAAIREISGLAASMLAIVAGIGLISAEFFFLVQYLFYWNDPQLVARVSALYMQLDLEIFGAYPVFALQALAQYPFIEHLVLLAYGNLDVVFSGALIILLFKNIPLLRSLFLSFFIAIAIGLPFWYLFPAISPYEMYVFNDLSLPLPPDIAAHVAGMHPSELLTGYLDYFASFWISPSGEWLAISANPSMHAAWGILIAYFVYRASRRWGAVFIAWSVLNAVGAVYTFEHYAVDIIAGALVALAAIALTIRLMRFERSYYLGDLGFLAILEAIQNDASTLKKRWLGPYFTETEKK